MNCSRAGYKSKETDVRLRSEPQKTTVKQACRQQKAYREEGAEGNCHGVYPSSQGHFCGSWVPLTPKVPSNAKKGGRSEPKKHRRGAETGTCGQTQGDIPQPQRFHVAIEGGPPCDQFQTPPSPATTPMPTDSFGPEGSNQIAPATEDHPGEKMKGVKPPGGQHRRTDGVDERFGGNFGEVGPDKKPHHECGGDQSIGDLEVFPIDQGDGHGKQSEDSPPQGRLQRPPAMSGQPYRRHRQRATERLHQHIEHGNLEAAPRAPPPLQNPRQHREVAVPRNAVTATRTTRPWGDHGLLAGNPPYGDVEKRSQAGSHGPRQQQDHRPRKVAQRIFSATGASALRSRLCTSSAIRPKDRNCTPRMTPPNDARSKGRTRNPPSTIQV